MDDSKARQWMNESSKEQRTRQSTSRRLEWWRTDGTIIQLPDPEKHGAPNHHTLSELLGDYGHGSFIDVDRYWEEDGKRRWLARRMDGEGKPNKAVFAQNDGEILYGDVVVTDNQGDLRFADEKYDEVYHARLGSEAEDEDDDEDRED
jgi:hypothetical protein